MSKYWIVESADIPPEYLTMEQGNFIWTKDREEALHFSRRSDAEKISEECEEAWFVRECHD